MKKIFNKVKNTKTFKYDDFINYKFNQLKNENRNIEKLKKSIIKHGFMAPVFIWKNNNENYVIDGTGRKKALQELEKEGYEIGEIPFVEIQAENLNDAKEKTLSISSSFGFITENDFALFAEDLDIDFDTFDIKFDNIGNIDILDNVNSSDENSEWVGMPEFEFDNNIPKIIISFENEEYRDEFLSKVDILEKPTSANKKTLSFSYPHKNRKDFSNHKYD